MNEFRKMLMNDKQLKSKKDIKKLVKKSYGGNKKARKKLNALLESGDRCAHIATAEYMNDALNEYSHQEGSTMIHEKDYVPMNCCLCGAYMETIHDTHSPDPIAPRTTAKQAKERNLPHRCCGKCNQTRVLPERLNNTTGGYGYKGTAIPKGALTKDGWWKVSKVDLPDDHLEDLK